MSVYGGGYAVPPPQVEFGWLSEGWSLFRQRTGAWIGAILLYGIVYILMEFLILAPTGMFAYYQELFQSLHNSGQIQKMTPQPPPSLTALTYGASFLIGIVNTVLMGGLFRMAYRQIQGEEVGAADLFSVGDCFAQLVVLGVFTSIISLVGGFSCGIPVVVFYALAMFAPLIIVSRGAGATAAISESFNLLKGSWLMAIVFVIGTSLLFGVSFLACLIGEFVILPMIFLGIAYGYTRFSGPQYAQFPGYEAPQPGTWPPPPGANQPQPPGWGQPAPPQPPGWGQPAPPQPPGWGQPAPPQSPGWGQPAPPQQPQPGEERSGPQQGGPWLGGDSASEDDTQQR